MIGTATRAVARIGRTRARGARRALARAGRAALAVVLVALLGLPALPAPALAGDAGAAAATSSMGSVTALAPPPASSAVIDYSGKVPAGTPARLKSAGVAIAIRYVADKAWKSMTPAEARALRAGGIDIAAVYEAKADWMLGGYSAGVKAAKLARAGVIKCGGPRRPFVWFACDVGTHRMTTVNSCLHGAASVLGADHVGIYGSYSVCDAALKSGWAAKAWQTLAWSSGKVLPQAAIYQTTGKPYGNLHLDYDADFVRADDVGQWGYTPASVGWQLQSSPTTANLSAVDLASASEGWTVGEAGTILHTTVGGATWSPQSSPNSADLTSVRLTSGSGLGSGTGWAVGDSGTILRTTDGGAAWGLQSAPTSADLRALDLADATTGWAVGDHGTVLHTANGGATWTLQSTPTSAALRTVRFWGANIGWAAGSGGTVLRTLNGGVSWTLRSAPTTATLDSIDFADSQTGWAVGEAGTVVRTLDGGMTWARQSVPTTATLTSVQFVDRSTGWAVGEGGAALQTTNGGLSWTTCALPTAESLAAVRFAGSPAGWAIGTGGTIVRVTNSAASPFGTVSGFATDARNGAALGGINVSVGGRPAAPTAVDGSYVAARVVPGIYGVAFSHPRWIGRTESGVGVSAGQHTCVSKPLTPRMATSLTAPGVEPTAPLRGQTTTLTLTMSPSAAATSAVTTLYGSRYEWKWASRKVKGKKRKVKVWFWRFRLTLPMTADASGTLHASRVIAPGLWRIQAKYPGTWKYLPSASATTRFFVH